MRVIEPSELQQGQLVSYRVREEAALVLSSNDSAAVLLRPNHEVDVVGTIWGEVVDGEDALSIATNEKSGISHVVVNGETLCGNKWNVGGNTQDEVGVITCETCNQLFKKMEKVI